LCLAVVSRCCYVDSSSDRGDAREYRLDTGERMLRFRPPVGPVYVDGKGETRPGGWTGTAVLPDVIRG